MKPAQPKTIDEFIAAFPEKTQKILKQVRATIREEAPEATESISYGIPTCKLNGKPLIYFSGYEKHIGIYPAPREAEEFKQELSAYKGGKGTVQFPLNKPIPYELIARMVKYRLKALKQSEFEAK